MYLAVMLSWFDPQREPIGCRVTDPAEDVEFIEIESPTMVINLHGYIITWYLLNALSVDF